MNQGYAPDPAHQSDITQQTIASPDAPMTGAANEVAQSAKEHAREAGSDVMRQGRQLAGQVGDRLSGEARSQNDRLASGLRKLADDLNQMGDGTGSVASTVIRQVGDTSKQAAKYLETHGPDGLLRDVQQFARRRPGAFLLTAAAAGFLAGRLGKGLLSSSSPSPNKSSQRLTAMGFTPAGQAMPNPAGRTPVSAEPPVAVGSGVIS